MVKRELLREDSQKILISASRVARYTLIFLISLFVVRLVVSIFTGSIALLADALNSLSDTLIIVVIYFSLHVMTKKPNGRFPYGYYRLEDLVELFMSITFFILAVSIVMRGIYVVTTGLYVTHNYGIAVVLEIVAGVSSLVIASHQKRIAEETGVGSLALSARDLQIDAIAAFFVALNIFLNSWYTFPFEGIAAIIIGLLIITTAFRGAKSSLKGLLDIWDKPELIAKIKNIINEHAPLKAGEIRLRRVGPFIFGDAIVYAPEEMRLEDIDDIMSDIENEIRNKIPEIIDFVINVEPLEETRVICAIPAEEDGIISRIAEKFECADKFLIVSIDPKSGSIETLGVLKNIFRRRRNPEVKICKELLKYNVDCVVVKDIGETSFELLKAYSVDTYRAEVSTIEEILRNFINQKLKFIEKYESTSNEEIEEKQCAEVEGPISEILYRISGEEKLFRRDSNQNG